MATTWHAVPQRYSTLPMSFAYTAAQPDLPPEEAAKIIGGMLLTDQVTIDFQGGTCPLVPDGDLHVI